MRKYDHERTTVNPGDLSTRELQVLYWYLRGYKTDRVGEILFVDRKTIERHINAIYNKFGMATTGKSKEIENQNTRSAICWIASRDGWLKSLTSDGLIDCGRDNLHHLTQTESLMVELLKKGNTNREIAAAIKVSFHTV